MPSSIASDRRGWQIFWSHKSSEGVLFRYKVRQMGSRQSSNGEWHVCTEVREKGKWPPYHTASIVVPAVHGKAFYDMSPMWSNVNEGGNSPYPPGYEKGFERLEDKSEQPTRSDQPKLVNENGIGGTSVSKADGGTTGE